MEIEGIESVELVDEENKEGDEPQGIRITTVLELANSVSEEVMGAMGTKLKVEKVGIYRIDPERGHYSRRGYVMHGVIWFVYASTMYILKRYSNVRPA